MALLSGRLSVSIRLRPITRSGISEVTETAQPRIALPGASLTRDRSVAWRWLRPLRRLGTGRSHATRAVGSIGGVGLVSTAPLTEISGQGRVLNNLVSASAGRRVVVMSDMLAAAGSNGSVTSLPLARPALVATSAVTRAASIVAAIHGRAIEMEAIARREELQALVACTGDLYSLGASALAAGRLDIPLLVYLFDDPVDQWADRGLRRVARSVSQLWAPRARAAFVPNEVLFDAWRERCRHLVLIRNAVSSAPDRAARRDVVGDLVAGAAGEDPASIVYAGSVYHAQADAIRNLLTALVRLQGRYHLHIYSAQSRAEIEGCGISGAHVTLHGAVSPAAVPAVLASASLLFLPLGFDTGIPRAIRSSSPAKMGEYLAAGRPILAHVPADSHVASFCRQNDCAMLVDQPDCAGLVDILSRLAKGEVATERLRRNALSVAEQFSAPFAARIFWSTLDDAIAAP
jgi:glycosyltransferase involved in cell wall biosynthesis